MFAGVTAATLALVLAIGSPAGLTQEQAAPTPASETSLTTVGPGPAIKYDCALTVRPAADAFTGADGTASEIGWEGNQQGVVTCLGGVFFIQDRHLPELRLWHLRRCPDHLDRR